MPQNFTAPQIGPARLRQGLGFVPKRQPTGDGSEGIIIDPNSGAASVDIPTVAASLVIFGTGAPGGTPAFDGQLYFDDTLAMYSGYVGRGGVWNQFS